MIVELFCFESNFYGKDAATRRINDYIKSNESKGFTVIDKVMTNGGQGGNSLIKPQITIAIWMDKQ